MTDDADRFEGLDRFSEIKAKVVELHKLEHDDQRVSMIAGLMFAQETMIAQMAAGERVDYTAFGKITDLLKEHVPPIIPKIELKLVGPAVTQCPKCDHVFDPESPERAIVWHYDNVATPDAKVAKKEVAVAPENAPKATASRDEAVPERPYHETMIKDTRPNASANGHGGGSLCWIGTGTGSKYPLDRER